MALIKCKECGKEISDQATTCPNCGAKTETAKKEENKEGIYIAIFVGLALIIFVACFIVNNGQIPLFTVEGQGTITIE